MSKEMRIFVHKMSGHEIYVSEFNDSDLTCMIIDAETDIKLEERVSTIKEYYRDTGKKLVFAKRTGPLKRSGREGIDENGDDYWFHRDVMEDIPNPDEDIVFIKKSKKEE